MLLQYDTQKSFMYLYSFLKSAAGLRDAGNQTLDHRITVWFATNVPLYLLVYAVSEMMYLNAAISIFSIVMRLLLR